MPIALGENNELPTSECHSQAAACQVETSWQPSKPRTCWAAARLSSTCAASAPLLMVSSPASCSCCWLYVDAGKLVVHPRPLVAKKPQCAWWAAASALTSPCQIDLMDLTILPNLAWNANHSCRTSCGAAHSNPRRGAVPCLARSSNGLVHVHDLRFQK
jgi:hypothetical protein